MKYNIKSDLVWNRANALSCLYSFVSHMSCAGHPHMTVSICNYCVSVVIFMEEEDDVNDIEEVANHYLSDLWESEENEVRDGDGFTRWIEFKYHWKD